MENLTHLQQVMAAHRQAQLAAQAHANSLHWYDDLLETKRFHKQAQLEMEVIEQENKIDYILKLAFQWTPGVASEFNRLLAPINHPSHG